PPGPGPLPHRRCLSAMGDERFAEICRRHPDLVAVYESGRGRLGLLLPRTLVALDTERGEWGGGVTPADARGRRRGDVRAGGSAGAPVWLQGLPIHDVARIVARWIRRWD